MINEIKVQPYWMRHIEVRLSSKINRRQLIFNNLDPNKNNIDIQINGTKYIGTSKDCGTVAISNLEYDTILKIINEEYYSIEILVGYQSFGNLETYFKGQVSFINQKIHAQHDTTTYITYASNLVAAWSQGRMNFQINSGINLYSALGYICNLTGIKERNISPELKSIVLQKAMQSYSSPVSAIDYLSKNSNKIIVNEDQSFTNAVINMTHIEKARRVQLNPNSILISKGNPTLTSAGLKMTLLPTFNFCPGDIIYMRDNEGHKWGLNSLIDTSINNPESVKTTFNTNYLDPNGEYMIMEIDYSFASRSNNFELNITARQLSYLKNIQLGG